MGEEHWVDLKVKRCRFLNGEKSLTRRGPILCQSLQQMFRNILRIWDVSVVVRRGYGLDLTVGFWCPAK